LQSTPYLPEVIRMPLLDRDDSLLVVIDTQPGFYRDRADVDADAFELFVARVAWLAGSARALEIPVVVLEEEPERYGATADSVRAQLPPGSDGLPKEQFGLMGNPELRAAVERTGRRTAVLVGMETDVCVAHSAVGLRDEGYRVAVATDATYSPLEAHAHGLARLRDGGVELLSAKGVLYDWLRSVQASIDFVADNPELANPPGFSL
jgi:nicotinamidase-related amidase